MKRSKADKGKGVAVEGKAEGFDNKRFILVVAKKRFEILKHSKFTKEKEYTFGDDDGFGLLITNAGMVGTVQGLAEFDV